jgi:hypothetical protein
MPPTPASPRLSRRPQKPGPIPRRSRQRLTPSPPIPSLTSTSPAGTPPTITPERLALWREQSANWEKLLEEVAARESSLVRLTLPRTVLSARDKDLVQFVACTALAALQYWRTYPPTEACLGGGPRPL